MGNLIELKDDIKSGEIPKYILISGEESFLVSEASSNILDDLLPEKLEGINYERWTGEKDRIKAFFEDYLMYPLLADKKVFHVVAGENLVGMDSLASSRDRMERIIKQSVPETNVLLISCQGKVDKKRKIYKFFKKNGFIVEYPLIKTYYPGDIEKDKTWGIVKKRCQAANCSMSEKAFFELRKRVTDNLWALTSEVDKLINYVGLGETIELNDVQELISISKSDQVFDLISAITEKKLKAVVSLFSSLVSAETNLLGIHTMLFRQLQMAFISKQWIKQIFKKGLPRDFNYFTLRSKFLPNWNNQLAASGISAWDFLLKRHPYAVYNTLISSSKFSDSSLIKALTDLEELELKVKSQAINHKNALEMIVIKLCQR